MRDNLSLRVYVFVMEVRMEVRRGRGRSAVSVGHPAVPRVQGGRD